MSKTPTATAAQTNLDTKSGDTQRSEVITGPTETTLSRNQTSTNTKSIDAPQQQVAAEGLLMLQELAQLDAPDPNDLPDIPIIADNTEKD